MQSVKGNPYFVNNVEKIKSYDYLKQDICCDILIIGGGIDGAVANYFLSKNYDVSLVEKSRLGHCATSCATSLLEYQLDSFSFQLKHLLSQSQLIQVYRAGIYGLDKMSSLIHSLNFKCEFSQTPTLLYSNCILDRPKIQREFNFRIKQGFDCSFITKTNNPFSFKIDSGILCANGGTIQPYLFEKMLIENSKNQSKIYENTQIVKINKLNNRYVCHTSYGEKIFCKEVILATGFNFDLSKNATRLCKRYISFTVVTAPLLHPPALPLVQDCLNPYHYLRTLKDNRLIYGGEDIPFKGDFPTKSCENAYKKLNKSLQRMFPQYKFKIDFKFCGLFGTTQNNLGIIGRDEQGIINFLSCGANGIVNSMFGIEIVENILKNKPHPLASIFSPLRKH